MLIDIIVDLHELDTYGDDILECCRNNPQIFDYQHPINKNNPDEILDSIGWYIKDAHSMVHGIFSDDREFLFGFIIYENIKMTDDGNSAQLHLCSSKGIWGKDFLILYKSILRTSIFNSLYAIMPSCCRGAITLCKNLGFKKTGYIPKSTPYVNTKGKVKMFDQFIYSYTK